MRRKLQDIIRGKIEQEEHSVVFPQEKLSFTVIENGSCQERFTFTSGSDQPVRGYVSCPNPRISCVTEKFDGTKNTIQFEYRASGMTEGSEEQGYFVLTTNDGEYLYPYHAVIRKNYTHTSIGWIKTLNDFTNLAKLNWTEALALFASGSFTQIFHKGEERELALYRGLTSRGSSSAQMEEFLVGIGKKKCNRFFPDKTRQTFITAGIPFYDEIKIEKSEWGYLNIQVSTDQPFIELSATSIRGGDFNGKHFIFRYRILPEKMHEGRNMASIVFETVDQRFEVEIIAAAEQVYEKENEKDSRRVVELQLEQQFLSYRLGRTERSAWMKTSVSIISAYIEKHSEEIWFRLYLAYIYFICKENESAQDVMSGLEDLSARKREPIGGFYLYLTTFLNADRTYCRDVTRQIRELHQKFPNDLVLSWILLELDEALLRSDERRFLFVKRLMNKGSISPMLYLEGYRLAVRNPDLLHENGRFERRLVRWIVDQGLLFADLVPVILQIASRDSAYHPYMVRIMSECYMEYETDDLLKAICSYLINFSHFTDSSFLWFERGVLHHIRLAGLYEAYLRSWNPNNKDLPAEIIRYFMMQNKVQLRWQAKIYAWLICHQDQYQDEWNMYDIKIRSFAVKALKTPRMDEDLIVIYRYLQPRLSHDEWLEAAGHIEQTCRIIIKNNMFTHVCIMQAPAGKIVTIPLHKGCAYVRISDPKALILLQDTYGNIYYRPEETVVKPMFAADDTEDAPGLERLPESESERRERELNDVVKRLERFDDSLEKMDRLVIRAKKLGLHTMLYEEKMLARMLFAGIFTASHEIFFRDICLSHENIQLCDAYVTRLSREYIANRMDFTEDAADYIMQSRRLGRQLSDFCEAALLKNQYTSFELMPMDEVTARRLLQKEILNDEIFDYYNQLPAELKNRYLLNGRIFLQYVGKIGTHCELHYRITIKNSTVESGAENRFFLSRKKTMMESLPGIYCTGIPAFHGADYEYQIVSADGEKTEAATFHYEEGNTNRQPMTRYDRLEELFRADGPDSERVEAYRMEKEVTETAFKRMRVEDDWADTK